MARTYAKCTHCENRFPVVEMVKYFDSSRGGRVAYQCADCANRTHSHYTTNTEYKGKVKSEPWTVSVELETADSTAKGRAELMRNRFTPTLDVTVDCEYKSPVYNGFGGPVKYAKSIEKMVNSGDLVIDSSCGTHCHIGYGDVITAHYLEYCFCYREYILTPAENTMDEVPEKVNRLFGRGFNRSWARRNRETDDRYTWVNFESSTGATIEFRINFFREAKQFAAMVMLEKRLVAILLKHFSPEVVCYYSTTDEERRNMAIKTGRYFERAIRKALDEF